MLEFLLAVLAAGTVGALRFPLLRPSVHGTGRLEADLALYRDQLTEIERERATGTLGESEAASARVEIERRLLTAAEQDKGELTSASPTLHRFLPPAVALLIPLFALGLYLQIGRPGLQPVRATVDRAANAQPAPDTAAIRAYIAANPEDAEARSALGEALVEEAGGTVPAEAVEAFTAALARQPNDARAIFYLGLHEAQSGDAPAALKRWQDLAARSPPDAPYLPMLRAEMARVAKAAGLPAPEAPKGPTREQVEAMGSLTPEQRQQAIRGMVEGLDAKLRDAPQDRDGWLRLATARKVLNENDKAAEAYARADALQPLEPRLLADWSEALVRQIAPGGVPSPAAVAVLQRLEQADPRHGLALFYLGAASFASGDKPEAARRWKILLTLLPPDAPIRGMLEEKIKEAGP